MLTKLLIAFSLMALCVTIHAMGLMAVFRLIESRGLRGNHDFWRSAWRLIRIASFRPVCSSLLSRKSLDRTERARRPHDL